MLVSPMETGSTWAAIAALAAVGFAWFTYIAAAKASYERKHKGLQNTILGIEKELDLIADAHVCGRIRGRKLTDQDEALQHGGLDSSHRYFWDLRTQKLPQSHVCTFLHCKQ